MNKTKNLNLGKSNNGTDVWAPDFVPKKFGAKSILTANTEKSIVVPNNVDIALLGYSSASEVQVSPDAGEALPVQGDFVETSARLTPPTQKVTPGDTLYFKSPQNDWVYIQFVNTKSNLS
jgi:hypothetical protein